MSSFTARIPELERQLQIRVIRDAADTLDLRYATYVPGGGTPKRWLVFLNGRTEWIEKYVYVFDDLKLPAGTGVVTMDHRGQGASGGARSYVSHYDWFASDVARVVAEATGGKPYVLAAHSMGALIGLYATLKGAISPRSLVLASPLLGLPKDPLPHAIGKPLAQILTTLRFGAVSSGIGKHAGTAFEDNKLTHHPELYARMRASPYNASGATFGWVTASFHATSFCFESAALAKLAAPTLVLAGSDDRVVDLDAIPAWVQRAAEHAPVNVQLLMIPGGRHELYSETDEYYRPALAATRAWVLKGLEG
jgi:alpha-beta hydrolase superfamily lysophospholipase